MAGIIRITLVSTLGDQDLLNSFWWVGDAAILADAEELADNFNAIMVTRFEFAWSTSYVTGNALINMWEDTPGNPLNPSIPTTVGGGRRHGQPRRAATGYIAAVELQGVRTTA